MKDKRQADAELNRMLGQLKGKWTGRVWENLGWHCSAYLGPLSIYYCEHTKRYSCLLTTGDDFPNHGEIFWNDNESFSDPNEAVRHQLDLANRHIQICRDAVDAVTAGLEAA